ncbi:MAG: amino acid adenylation domain-containing protein [bacterium]|nr:amino acid adenylation domain-containing protein [bacterium]
MSGARHELGARVPPRDRADSDPVRPLAPAQRRFWYAHQLFQDEAVGNEAVALELRGRLDSEALEVALLHLLARHEGLRSSWFEFEGEPGYRVHKAQLDLTTSSAEGLGDEDLFARIRSKTAVRQDLATHPTTRFELIRRGPKEHLLVAYIPHLALDGWSYLKILPEDLLALYVAECNDASATRPAPPRQYRAFAEAQLAAEGSEAEARGIAWWTEKLNGAPAALELPTDRCRPPIVDPGTKRIERRLPIGLRRDLLSLGHRHGASLADILLAAWNLLLHRMTGAEDIVVGMPLANREPGYRDVFGCLMNPVCVRTDLAGDPSFAALLQRILATKRESFPYRRIPMDRVYESVGRARRADPSRNPIYQVMFNYIDFVPGPLEAEGLRMDVRRLEVPALLDLTLHPEDRANETNMILEYATALFERESAARMLEHLQRLLEEVVLDDERPISRLPLLGDPEKQRVLYEWNDTETARPDDALMFHAFEQQARGAPDRIALLFGETTVSYGDLNARANRLANYLGSCGVGRGSLVGVCVQRGIELIVALLAVQKAGAAYLPLDPDYPPERLRFMLDDADAAIVVTEVALAERLPADRRLLPVDAPLEQRAIAKADGEAPPPIAEPTDRAYIIYTSGSTGKPKGVVVRHHSAVNLITWVNERFAVGPDDRLLFVTSPCFDLSVYDIFGTLAAGASIRIASSEDLQEPDALVELLTQGGITFWDSAPAALGQLVPFLREPAADTSLRLVFLSGDWIPVPLPDQVRRAFPAAEVVALGGATEATIWSNYYVIDQVDPDWTSIPYGRPISNARYYILDRHLEPVPIGVPGELFIGGPCLASGYHARPDLNAERFLPDPFGEHDDDHLYRTGDIARFLPDGNIEFLGRQDHQVKVGGYRVELGEIATALESHPGISRSIATAPRNEHGERDLVAHFVPEPASIAETPSDASLRDYLRAKLPAYMIPVSFVAIEKIPLTANGKVDLDSLPAACRDARDPVLPSTAPERALAGLWSQELGFQVDDVHADFFCLGGTSIRAVRLLSAIRDAFDRPLQLRDLYREPTISGLARILGEECAQRSEARIPRRGSGTLWPISSPQLRMWYTRELSDDPTLYNVCTTVELGKIDVAAFGRAWARLVARHETLRTCFEVVDGRPFQRLLETGEGALLGWRDISNEPPPVARSSHAELVRAEVGRAFDLAIRPWRAVLVRIDEEDHRLLFNQHHIITDDWSLGILMGDLAALYEAERAGAAPALAALEIDYTDYSVWEADEEGLHPSQNDLAFWRDTLGEVETLELPADEPEPSNVSGAGRRRRFEIGPHLHSEIEALARTEGATPYTVYLAALVALAHRYSGQEDITISTPVSIRGRPELEPLAGCLINMLPVRIDVSGEPSFRELLRRTRDASRLVFEHRETALERIVENQRSVNPNVSQLQQLVFNYVEAPEPIDVDGQRWNWQVVPPNGAKFDLSFHVQAGPDGLVADLSYRSQRFDDATALRLTEHWQHVLQAAVQDPDRQVWSLPLITQAERRRLLGASNDLEVDYPRDCSLASIFEERVDEDPNHVALRWHGGQLLYGELDARANQIAHALREAGVRRGSRVGVLLERGPDFVATILAILKADACYVPLDPEAPAERLSFMAEDANLSVSVTDQSLAARLPTVCRTVVRVDEAAELRARSTTRANGCATGSDPAYVMYTSGSTGQPKGVVVPQRGVTRLTHGVRWAELGPDTVLCLLSPVFFDLSTFEIFGALLTGGTLAIRAPGPPTLDVLDRAISELGVNALSIPTGLFHALVSERPESLRPVRQLFPCGDVLSPEIARIVARELPETRLWNLYGPTECTVYATGFEVEVDPGAHVPIGWPIENTTAYVLDPHGEPCPINVPGELHLGGDGVATEYLNRPELTAERFVTDPFASRSGRRMFRTGDLARRRADGRLEFLGRLDRQVKIRGHRIELGEIEAALYALSEVGEALVMARTGPDGLYLAAYVIESGGELDPSEVRMRLAGTLPAAAIPDFIVPIDAIPLTERGKIDRDALPDPLAVTTVRRREPRDDLERRVEGIWKELLQRTVDVDEDFFRIGGNSLMALQLTARLEVELGKPVPLAALLRTPTIAGLANALRGGTEPDDTEREHGRQVICFQRGAKRPPLWLVHPIGGYVVYAHWLADHQDPDLPIYGIEACGLAGSRAPLETIEEMAEFYIALIREVQPEGPYYLGGYSLGGLIAYEIAQKLHDEGAHVERVILLDTYAPGYPRHLPAWRRMLSTLARAGRSPVSKVASALVRRIRRPNLLFGQDARKMLDHYDVGDEVDGVRGGRVRDVIEAGRTALCHYRARPYAGNLHVIAAIRQPDYPGVVFDDPGNGWGEWARGGLEVDTVDCHHVELLNEPARAEVGAHLRALLARAHGVDE